MKAFLFALSTTATAIGALPSVGPNYQRPVVDTPPTYREAARAASHAGEPPALALEWWHAFHDPVLDALELRALSANQDLRAALARVEQARAISGVVRSSYLPALAAAPTYTRDRFSRNVENALPDGSTRTHRLSLDLAWEIDLFGRGRRLNESARAEFESAGANFAAAQLALTAEVATTHFTLRALNQELRILNSTTLVRRDALQLVRSRFERGHADDLALARAETELATTEAEAAALAIRRAAAENALGVLLGGTVHDLTVATAADFFSPSIPRIPAGLPGDLLTRRADLAAAERALAAASARIGVAQAAFFPAIALTGATGYASTDITDLTRADSRLWSFGPSVYLPIFQGGRNRANLGRARAAYEESAALYRQSVLIAVREVQDALTASQLLAEQADAQARAAASARRGADLAQRRYEAGFVSYIEVIDAQRTALAIERAEAQLAGQRWITQVALIKALGGGWHQPSEQAPSS